MVVEAIREIQKKKPMILSAKGISTIAKTGACSTGFLIVGDRR